jgi:hypothetical protein
MSEAGGLWGAATPYILAVYGLTAVSLGALVVLSLVELGRWSRKARELERKSD